MNIADFALGRPNKTRAAASFVFLDSAFLEALPDKLGNAITAAYEKLEAFGDSLETVEEQAQALLELAQYVEEAKAYLKAKAHAEKIETETPPPLNIPARHNSYFEYEPNKTRGQRQKDNNAAVGILNALKKDESRTLNEGEKIALSKYSGSGGNLKRSDGLKGSAYEYYTPKPIAEGCWDLLKSLGFEGGKVLDPCAGVGVFGATAPANTFVDAVELNEVSAKINHLLNDGEGQRTTHSPFEAFAANNPDGVYDAVVANVPFGKASDRGANARLDPRYSKSNLETYFILRSLEKLKPNGLAVFICPTRVVSGLDKSMQDLRQNASEYAEFLGAFRLPSKVFNSASTDVVTDVLAFKKFSTEHAETIKIAKDNTPSMLAESNVWWAEFLHGKYFEGEGKAHVLGEFVPRDPTKIRDMDKVLSDKTVPEISQLIRKLPQQSRINWDLLNDFAAFHIENVATEGELKVEADTTYIMTRGEWKNAKDPGPNNFAPSGTPPVKPSLSYVEGHMQTPESALANGVTFAQANEYYMDMRTAMRGLDIPQWLTDAVVALESAAKTTQSKAWKLGLVGLSLENVLADEADNHQCNYLENYPELSSHLKTSWKAAQKPPQHLSLAMKNGVAKIKLYFDGKDFSAFWKGEIAQKTEAFEPVEDSLSIDSLVYKNKSVWLDIQDVFNVMGDPEFNPFSDPNWCVSPDGKRICRADDYFVGNVGAKIKKLEADISAAGEKFKQSGDKQDELILQKLQNMRTELSNRYGTTRVDRLSFGLMNPLIDVHHKLDFVKNYIHPSAAIGQGRDGKYFVDIKTKGENEKEKLLNRFGDYLRNGTVSLGGIIVENPNAALEKLKGMVNAYNAQFNIWVKANSRIMAEIKAKSEDPERLQFDRAVDEMPLKIPGVNPLLRLNGYQNAFVRMQGRRFGGGLGDGVGLGKTFQGLVATQYAQAIGAKSKTLFVVPNSVLSNWRKEAQKAYTNIEDCLFVGLREKNGRFVTDPKYYDADLTIIRENRHKKIFLTLEAFQRIKIKNETIDGFKNYLRSTNKELRNANLSAKEEERVQAWLENITEKLGEKTGAAPFFEDLWVDSIVIDEAHVYKNSTLTVSTKNARGLSLAKPSARGIDAQCKAWYLRRLTGGDGVLLLTATPITNSPVEVYSMLSLAVGANEINNMMMDLDSVDEFLELICEIDNEEVTQIDGRVTMAQVFNGLNNIDLLKSTLNNVFTMRTAAEVGATIIAPDAAESSQKVVLPKENIKRLKELKLAWRYASNQMKAAGNIRGTPVEMSAEDRALAHQVLEKLQAELGEPISVLASPFNLITRMQSFISDPDLETRTTIFFTQDSATAKKVVDEFNNKKIKEEREKLTAYSRDNNAILGKKVQDEKTLFKVHVKAYLENKGDAKGMRITLDTLDSAIIAAFEKIADKNKLELDFSTPAKLAAMIENFKKEMGNPRGIDSEGKPSKKVRQIIFCDTLGMHHKIRRALARDAGLDASKIAIITGQTNNKPEEIQEVQDGFNAAGEDNKYLCVIANEKAEVGINLQKGTQAIHHLTTGWTPDSITQRNGRGVRQGNETKIVNIYYYDAEGTFDEVKREMVNKKADWIKTLTAKNDKSDGSIIVGGSLSQAQIEALLDVTGSDDPAALSKVQARIAEEEKKAQRQKNRATQSVQIKTLLNAEAKIKENNNPIPLLASRFFEIVHVEQKIEKAQEKLEKVQNLLQADDWSETELAKIERDTQKLERQLQLLEAELKQLDPEDIVKTIGKIFFNGADLKLKFHHFRPWLKDREDRLYVLEKALITISSYNPTVPFINSHGEAIKNLHNSYTRRNIFVVSKLDHLIGQKAELLEQVKDSRFFEGLKIELEDAQRLRESSIKELLLSNGKDGTDKLTQEEIESLSFVWLTSDNGRESEARVLSTQRLYFVDGNPLMPAHIQRHNRRLAQVFDFKKGKDLNIDSSKLADQVDASVILTREEEADKILAALDSVERAKKKWLFPLSISYLKREGFEYLANCLANHLDNLDNSARKEDDTVKFHFTENIGFKSPMFNFVFFAHEGAHYFLDGRGCKKIQPSPLSSEIIRAQDKYIARVDFENQFIYFLDSALPILGENALNFDPDADDIENTKKSYKFIANLFSIADGQGKSFDASILLAARGLKSETRPIDLNGVGAYLLGFERRKKFAQELEQVVLEKINRHEGLKALAQKHAKQAGDKKIDIFAYNSEYQGASPAADIMGDVLVEAFNEVSSRHSKPFKRLPIKLKHFGLERDGIAFKFKPSNESGVFSLNDIAMPSVDFDESLGLVLFSPKMTLAAALNAIFAKMCAGEKLPHAEKDGDVNSAFPKDLPE